MINEVRWIDIYVHATSNSAADTPRKSSKNKLLMISQRICKVVK